MSLLELPTELLLQLPSYLHNIEDFNNLSSCCRLLHEILPKTTPNRILQLAAASSRIFFQPDPHFLIAATVRQLSKWALLAPTNTDILRTAIKEGVEALLKLCIDKSGITLEEIRRLYLIRFSTFNPITDLIDKCAGKQWCSVPNFWDGGASDACTVNCEPARAMYQIIIYGELFASSMEAHLDPGLDLPRFDVQMRLDYIRHCIPDWCVAHIGSPGLGKPDPVGIFVPGNTFRDADEFALNHLLKCRKWTTALEVVRKEIAEDFDVFWKQDMWEAAISCQGLEGMEAMRNRGMEGWKERMLEVHGKIQRLDEQPLSHEFGHRDSSVFDYPSIIKDVYVCMAGYWRI